MTGGIVPIGHVAGGRAELRDDDWGDVRAVIRLDRGRVDADATLGLDAFSHLEVVTRLHRADPAREQRGARHPRGNAAWPRVGILAQRGKDRPNRIGVSRCVLERMDGLDLQVVGLDAVDGAPVLDVKPWMAEFGRRGATRQPAWATELMARYWSARPARP